ncbi:response regulator [Halobacterium noricense]|nr:response regulator [Halobacterium noricense]UHH26824.1 response regulator [Halobacterium noricense]
MAGEFIEREDDRIEVVTASNASDAHSILADEDIDCVVSDFDMPGQNGIEFLEAVREEHDMRTPRSGRGVAGPHGDAHRGDADARPGGTGSLGPRARRRRRRRAAVLGACRRRVGHAGRDRRIRRPRRPRPPPAGVREPLPKCRGA